MTNKELIAGIASESGLTQVDVAKAMDALVKIISDGVAKNDKVVVQGLGSFELKEKPERIGRNPQTGAEIKIAASKGVAFKATKSLKDFLNA
ncbi:MAG TPA: HU family DNA-binding protein [Clostridia bacterium]|nr:HU family DNA-binding protein [Clostridia bacterium]